MKYNPTVFREYDVRGKFDIDYDTEFAEGLGYAYAEFCKKTLNIESAVISVGIDARHSGKPLFDAIQSGIRKSGCRVIDMGLITSPVSYFSTYDIPDLSGSIMITGSHNPPEYNGFKISLQNMTLTGQALQEVKSIFENNPDLSKLDLKGSLEKVDTISKYVERLSTEFDFSASDFKFVIDCGNGAAGSVARKSFEACGLKPKILCEECDGDFPNHHPDPTIEDNLKMIKDELKSGDYDLGLAYDGDCDRVVALLPDGESIYSDRLMSVFSSEILKETPGATIIGDVKCSDELYTLIEKWGGNALMWKTGHSLIKNKIKEEKAPFGGEFSGHIFFNDRFYGFDDGIYVSLRLIEILIKSKKSLKDHLAPYPKTFSTPEIRIDVGEEKKWEIITSARKFFTEAGYKFSELDGVRLSMDKAWGLLRTSNTQPAITLRFEGTNEEALNSCKTVFKDFIEENFKINIFE